jgi:hypothetical protein
MFAPLARRTEWKPEAVKRDAERRPGIGDQRARNVARMGLGLGGGVQAKLSVGTVDDPLEAEADRIADQVMHRPERAGMGDAGRQSAARPRHEGSAASSSESLNGAGRPLDLSLRAFFEPRFGFDFSQVRIFSDEQAARSSQSMSARARTLPGQTLHLAAGSFSRARATGAGC